MPYKFENRIKYMENDVDIWEIAKIFLKLLRFLAQICGKRLKHVRNTFAIFEMA